MTNSQRLDLKKFGEKEVVNETILTQRQFDKHDPNWLNAHIRSDLLADEAELVNFGFEKETPVTTFYVEEYRPSLMASYPYNYKFTSVEYGAQATRKVY